MAIDDFFEELQLIEKKSVSDGMGGFTSEYVEGAEFLGAVSVDNSMEALIAQQQGVKSLYTITVRKNVNLFYDDVIKRIRDNRYLRITSNKQDIESPNNISEMELYQVKAEPYFLV